MHPGLDEARKLGRVAGKATQRGKWIGLAEGRLSRLVAFGDPSALIVRLIDGAAAIDGAAPHSIGRLETTADGWPVGSVTHASRIKR